MELAEIKAASKAGAKEGFEEALKERNQAHKLRAEQNVIGKLKAAAKKTHHKMANGLVWEFIFLLVFMGIPLFIWGNLGAKGYLWDPMWWWSAQEQHAVEAQFSPAERKMPPMVDIGSSPQPAKTIIEKEKKS